jgi:hypothetical protein
MKRVKKSYEKPTIAKSGRLSAVTASLCLSCRPG